MSDVFLNPQYGKIQDARTATIVSLGASLPEQQTASCHPAERWYFFDLDFTWRSQTKQYSPPTPSDEPPLARPHAGHFFARCFRSGKKS